MGPEDFGGSDEGSHYMSQDRIVTEDDGEAPEPYVHVPSGDLVDSGPIQATLDAFRARRAEQDKQAFLDNVAAQLFVSGWPQADLYKRAEVLWRLREAYRSGK